MGMTLKELLTKGEGTLTAGEAKTLASQCRMDVETLYTLLEERGIKILDDEADGDTSLDVEGIMAEVESAEQTAMSWAWAMKMRTIRQRRTPQT